VRSRGGSTGLRSNTKPSREQRTAGWKRTRLGKPGNCWMRTRDFDREGVCRRSGNLIGERTRNGFDLLQAVDVDLAPRTRNRRQVSACRDIHFSICDHRRAEFDAESRRVAAVRGAAIKLSREIRRVIREQRGAGWRNHACILQRIPLVDVPHDAVIRAIRRNKGAGAVCSLVLVVRRVALCAQECLCNQTVSPLPGRSLKSASRQDKQRH
jgi:hypothetical protein